MRKVVVTGVGVVSCVGSNRHKFWKNLVEGKSGIRRMSLFNIPNINRKYAGEVRDRSFYENNLFDEYLPRSYRFSLMAIKEALKDAGILVNNDITIEKEEIDIIVGTLYAGGEVLENKKISFKYYPVHKITSFIINHLRFTGYSSTVSGACASGNLAISYAYERVKRGDVNIAIAGGADPLAMCLFLGFYRLGNMAPVKCQPFDKNRKGLILSEGAAFLILESIESAKRRKANIYAEIIGYGISSDAFHPVKPCKEGVYQCMRDALENSRINIEDVDYINAHGTGTIQNDLVECQAIKKLFGKKYKRIPISSIKSMIGHSMGASSAMEAVACCFSLKEGIIPPTINYRTPDPECDIDCVPNTARRKNVKIILNNSFGFGGINCCTVFKKYEEKQCY